MRFRLRTCSSLLVLLSLCLTACGPDPAPEVEVPSWAKVAPEQIAEAKKHGVPVAFENDLGMRFVLIPAGTTIMGSSKEMWKSAKEVQRKVSMTRSYYMQITEVTNAEYSVYEPGYGDHLNSQSAREWLGFLYAFGDDDLPTVMQQRGDVRAFAAWLSSRNGRSYRLPLADEWEHACRAGTICAFNTGDSLTREAANFDGPGSDGLVSSSGGRSGGPVQVGTYPPNRWGLYDMHGNVNEWCADDREDGSGASGRVYRGGSFFGDVEFAAAHHWGISPYDVGFAHTGFRLVSPLPEPGE